MKPLPAVMLFWKELFDSRVRKAPARPAKMPPISTLR
jgi:hypothetical protein